MGGGGRGSSEPSAEQQRLSQEQLRLEEQRLALERQAAQRETEALQLQQEQLAQQAATNEQLLTQLREQNTAAADTTAQFSSLLERSVDIQREQAALQSQEATRAQGRQAEEQARVSSSLLGSQRDILERGTERRRRRRAGASAPVTTARERTSLLQR